MGCSIHPTALVDSNAELGEGVEVGPYSIVGANVKLGDRSRIASHVVIDGHTTLGAECSVFPFASLGAAPQDLKFKGEPSTLILGKQNVVREYVTLHPGTKAGRMTTTIGDKNLFMACSHVAHDCSVGNDNVFSNGVALAGHVTVGNRVVLGGMVGIHQFARIGDVVILGAGSMVAQDMPPFTIGQGDRCKLRGVNVIGLERAGFTAEQVSAVRKLYRHLFVARGLMKTKLESIPSELREQGPCKTFLDFLASSERGICSSSASAEEA